MHSLDTRQVYFTNLPQPAIRRMIIVMIDIENLLVFVSYRLEVAITASVVVIIAALLTGAMLHFIKKDISVLPLLEIILRPIAITLCDKLNRAGRSNAALAFRGLIVFTVLIAIVTAIAMGLYYFLPATTADFIFLLGCLAPLMPVLLAYNLSKDKPYKHAYRHESHALNRNLIHVDRAGDRRNGFDLIALALCDWFVAPLLIYAVFGITGLKLYIVASLIVRVGGETAEARPFILLAYIVWSVMRYIPVQFCKVIMFVALAVVPKGMPHKTLSTLLGRTLTATYATGLGVALGGSYQNRHGETVQRPWFGGKDVTAKLEHPDVIRGVYLHGVTLFLSLSMMIIAYMYL